MSNPLLRPNDPRFQRPPLTDGEGKNRFAEPDAATAGASSAEAGDNLYASPHATATAPYRPEYVSSYKSRNWLIGTLAFAALAANASAALALWAQHWFTYPLAFIALVAAVVSWHLSVEEFRSMRAGVVDKGHRTWTRLATVLAITCLLLALGLLAAAIVTGAGGE